MRLVDEKVRSIFVSTADEIADNILYDVVSDMYDMYVLFRGKISSSLFPNEKSASRLEEGKYFEENTELSDQDKKGKAICRC